MPKKPLNVILVLIAVISLTVMPSCTKSEGGSQTTPEQTAATVGTIPGASPVSSSDGTIDKPASPAAASLTKQSLRATDGSALCYWLYTPEDAGEHMPLLIDLYGGSGKGDDPDILLRNGFPKFLSEGSLGTIPAYIVIPQVSAGMKGWTDMKNTVRGLVRVCCTTYGTDSDRVGLTGHSMGGTGT